MHADQILEEIRELYGEWLEHAGPRSDELLIGILAQELAVQKVINIDYKKRLDHVNNSPRYSKMEDSRHYRMA